VSVCPPIAARQLGLHFDEKEDQPFSVGAETEQSSGPSPPSLSDIDLVLSKSKSLYD
jgi:hypothetical protein